MRNELKCGYEGRTKFGVKRKKEVERGLKRRIERKKEVERELEWGIKRKKEVEMELERGIKRKKEEEREFSFLSPFILLSNPLHPSF